MGLTLYFVGAGLTKSLELTRPVPVMKDFAPVLASYVNDGDVALNTLTQMEIGRVYQTACDDCLSLAEKIGRDVRAADGATRDRFADLVRGRPPESIEALFERVESTNPDTVGAAYAHGLPTLFRYAINQVFSAIGWELQLDLPTRFLTRQFENDQNAQIFVSFNYDLALDRAVGIASKEMWQPRDGYGFEFPFHTIDAKNAESTVGLPTGSPNIQILKPHGSLNWLRRTRNGVPPEGINGMVVPLGSRWERDTGIHWDLRYWPTEPSKSVHFPDDGVSCSRVEMLIAPPSPSKPPIMPQVLSAESDALIKADEVFVIGYSLPETDHDQRKLIKDAVGRRSKDIRRLTVVDYKASAKYFEDVEALFMPVDTRRFNDGFAEFSGHG